jgi:hypothetical protein
MGFLDKLKGAVQGVTGNAAKVTVEFSPQFAYPGDTVSVRVTATSNGREVTSKGVFIDLLGLEEVKLRKKDHRDLSDDLDVSRNTLEHSQQIAPAFVLAPNATAQFEGQFVVPGASQPTYHGSYASHKNQLRARLEAKGNDPDTGYIEYRVGTRN